MKKLISLVVVIVGIVCMSLSASAQTTQTVRADETETVYIEVSNEMLGNEKWEDVLGVNTLTVVNGFEPGVLD